MEETLKKEIAFYLLLYVAEKNKNIDDCDTYAEDITNMMRKKIDTLLE